MILKVIFLGLVNCLSAAFSIAITGKKSIIGGNLLEWKNFIALLFSWEFIFSMALALVARFSFIFLNSALFKIPAYQNQATTISVFIAAFSYVCIIIVNYFFLNEVLNFKQIIAVGVITLGIVLLLI